jgi:hypothetical protein
MDGWCIAAITCCEDRRDQKTNPPRRHGGAEKNKAGQYWSSAPSFLYVSKVLSLVLLRAAVVDLSLDFPD